jgi:hypothetical protein
VTALSQHLAVVEDLVHEGAVLTLRQGVQLRLLVVDQSQVLHRLLRIAADERSPEMVVRQRSKSTTNQPSAQSPRSPALIGRSRTAAIERRRRVDGCVR